MKPPPLAPLGPPLGVGGLMEVAVDQYVRYRDKKAKLEDDWANNRIDPGCPGADHIEH